ncbi:hypoxanthine phosphoribosyltransferase [Wandonia haliotis]|uniref:hypoxanthine phosphoribosyltransferase n=1 Tax=Wandonia haliotis TaxID=574963 RepID=UPI0031E3EEA5
MIIQLGDKKFRPYLSAEEIAWAVSRVSEALNEKYNGKQPIVLGVLNGAFMFCSDLVKTLTCGPEIHFVKVSSYEGTASSGNLSRLIGISAELKDRHVILVEDIVDTGLTVDVLRKELAAMGPASVEVATLLFKPDAFRGSQKPDYTGLEIPNDFVVGYGLDYNNLGRELPELYVIND